MSLNVSVSNTTRQGNPEWLQYYSMGCCVVLVLSCVLGLFGNSLSIAIFTQRHFRRLSINIFLAAMSIADLSKILLALPVFVPGQMLVFLPFWHKTWYLYSFSAVYLYPTLMIFHCASIWLLIVISFERWLAVCKPLLAMTYCTKQRAVISIIVICVLSFSYNVVRYWEFRLSDQSYRAVVALRKNPQYQLWYGMVSSLILVHLIPLVVMINFNLRITRELRRSFSRRRAMSATQKENQNTARMLFFLVSSFICCYTPSFVLSWLETMRPRLLYTTIGFVLCDGNNVIVILNASLTFVFYLIFSCRYRRAARSLFNRIFHRKAQLTAAERNRLYFLIETSPSVTFSKNSLAPSHLTAGGHRRIRTSNSMPAPADSSPATRGSLRQSQSLKIRGTKRMTVKSKGCSTKTNEALIASLTMFQDFSVRFSRTDPNTLEFRIEI